MVDGDAGASTVASAVDLESVAVHEIGHLLELGHSLVEEAISSRRRKVGVQELYGYTRLIL